MTLHLTPEYVPVRLVLATARRCDKQRCWSTIIKNCAEEHRVPTVYLQHLHWQPRLHPDAAVFSTVGELMADLHLVAYFADSAHRGDLSVRP